jgi:hypothetical protein
MAKLPNLQKETNGLCSREVGAQKMIWKSFVKYRQKKLLLVTLLAEGSGDCIGDFLRLNHGDCIGDPCFLCSPRNAWATEETWITKHQSPYYLLSLTFDDRLKSIF